MPLINGCCCFESLVKGSKASAILTLVVAVINFIIDVAMLVRMHYMERYSEPQQTYLYFPPGIIVLIYIELFASVGLFLAGVALIIGINQQHDGRKFILIWVVAVCTIRFYECFLGVYVMSWTGGHRFREMIFVVPETIVVTIYWVLTFFLLLAAVLCVVSYWQELLDELYGKERRIKYFRKMANIRAAAVSGTNTPSRSLWGSRTTLAQSHGSINPAFLPKF